MLIFSVSLSYEMIHRNIHSSKIIFIEFMCILKGLSLFKKHGREFGTVIAKHIKQAKGTEIES